MTRPYVWGEAVNVYSHESEARGEAVFMRCSLTSSDSTSRRKFQFQVIADLSRMPWSESDKVPAK